MGQPVEKGQFDGLAVYRLQLAIAERTRRAFSSVTAVAGGPATGDGVSAADVGWKPVLRPGCGGALTIDGSAASEGNEIGQGCAAAGIVAVGSPPDFQKNIGDQFLGFAPVVKHPQAKGEDQPAVAVVHRPERIGVAAIDAIHEIVIIRAVGHWFGS